MAIYCVDDEIKSGLQVRALQVDSVTTDLPSSTVKTVEGAETYAEVETNRGKLLCAVGTIAWEAGFKNIHELGSEGWTAVEESSET